MKYNPIQELVISIIKFSHGQIFIKKFFIIGSIMMVSSPILADWNPIIGIPDPEWGILQKHTDYADCTEYKYDYGNGEECYRIGPNGPYTHFIDTDHPSSTNTDNPYGTPTTPRESYPTNLDNLPAGSVLELHGSGYGSDTLNGSGTATKPIYIRGVKNEEPLHNGVGGFFINGSNYIIENIKFDMNQNDNTRIYIGYYDTGPITNIAIRNNEFYNGQYEPASSYQVIRARYAHNNDNLITNLVIFNNEFHNIGDGRTIAVKNDVVAVSIDANVDQAWIVDNKFDHIGGDGIQIAWDKYATSTKMPRYIYVGRNVAHDNYENFIDLKMCQDVIVSQNTAYNFGEGYTDLPGPTAIPYRYGLGEGPDDLARNNIWTLYNSAYNFSSADGGFSSFTGEGESLADEIYYIGNIAHGGHNPEGTGTCFFSSGQERVYWLNNVAYNCDRSGYFIGDNIGNSISEKLTLINNIFGDVHADSIVPYNLMVGAVKESLDRAIIKNNIYFNGINDTQFKVGVYLPPDPATWTAYTTYNNYCAAYPSFCIDSYVASPEYVDTFNADFNLISTSPAIDAGYMHSAYETFQSRYGLSIKVDYVNNLVPSGMEIDIGAYEYLTDELLTTEPPTTEPPEPPSNLSAK